MGTYLLRRTYGQAFKQEPVRFVLEKGRKTGIGALPHQSKADSYGYRNPRLDH